MKHITKALAPSGQQQFGAWPLCETEVTARGRKSICPISYNRAFITELRLGE